MIIYEPPIGMGYLRLTRIVLLAQTISNQSTDRLIGTTRLT